MSSVVWPTEQNTNQKKGGWKMKKRSIQPTKVWTKNCKLIRLNCQIINKLQDKDQGIVIQIAQSSTMTSQALESKMEESPKPTKVWNRGR